MKIKNKISNNNENGLEYQSLKVGWQSIDISSGLNEATSEWLSISLRIGLIGRSE